MSTKTVCDHCGNTISSYTHNNIFWIGSGNYLHLTAGPANALLGSQIYPTQAYQGINQTQNTTLGTSISTPPYLVKSIDLCQICIPIWWKRVLSLTEASDAR